MKDIHVTTVVISISLFVLRFYWMTIESKWLTTKVVKIAPHVNDTILLLSATVLAVNLGQYPFVDQWLTIKVIALVVYILLGTVALKRGKTKEIRLIAGFFAIFTFVFIIFIAVTKAVI